MNSNNIWTELKFSDIRKQVMLLLSFSVCFTIQSFAQIAIEADTIKTKKLPNSKTDSAVLSLKPSKDGLKAAVIYSADSVRLDVRNKKVYLYGNGKVSYEQMKLDAAYIEVDFETNDILAQSRPDSTGKPAGKPVFTSDGKVYYADEMRYNFKTKRVVSKGVVTEEEGGTGIVRGEKFYKDSADNMYVKNAMYTTCDAEHPHFWISAKKFKVVPNKQAISGPANLVIAGVNTPLVLPFGFFPLQDKRSKGILIGSYGNQQRYGFYIRDFGYYTPINDYMDFKFTGDLYSRGSFGVALKSNYKKLYKYNGNFYFKFNKFLNGEPESTSFNVANEYRVDWLYNQEAKAKPGRSFGANVNYQTRNQQKFTSSNIDDIVSTSASSNVTYARPLFNKKVNFTASGRITQNLSNGDLDINLPNLNFNMQRIQPFKSLPGSTSKLKVLRNLGLNLNSVFQNSINVNQDSIFEQSGRVISMHPDFTSGIRNGMKHSSTVNTAFSLFKYFNISPSVSLTEYWYLKTQEKEWVVDTLITRDVNGFSRALSYSPSVSINTTIYGTKNFKKPGSKVVAIRHIIQPSVSFAYNPDYTKMKQAGYRQVQNNIDGSMVDYSIYSSNIFRGPSGTESGGINFNVRNNFEMKMRNKNDSIVRIKLLESLNFGGAYNFLADSMKIANLSMSAFTTLFDLIRVNLNGTLDPYATVFDETQNNGEGANVRINKLTLTEGILGRFTYGNASMSTSLRPESFKKEKGGKKPGVKLDGSWHTDFTIPWDLSLTYTYTINKFLNAATQESQNIRYQGNLKLTDYWRIGFSSGYNFTTKTPGITSINFARDLHCWEFDFFWVPVGTYKQFNFVLKVKADKLKDLKIRQQETWFDAAN
ncbi:MAG: lipopolysaccharide assembly outer membrane protein LptD (OstA) [Bacteroidia bacterium]|jgi:lipopolysaccharide assembly outer membrane protein LptD (OstA)